MLNVVKPNVAKPNTIKKDTETSVSHCTNENCWYWGIGVSLGSCQCPGPCPYGFKQVY